MLSQRKVEIELGLVLVAFWLVPLLEQTFYLIHPRMDSVSGLNLGQVAYSSSLDLGRSAFLLLLIWYSGESFDAFGLRRPKSEELLSTTMVLAALGILRGIMLGVIRLLSTFPIGGFNFDLGRLIQLFSHAVFVQIFYCAYLQSRSREFSKVTIPIIVAVAGLVAVLHLAKGWQGMVWGFLNQLLLGFAFFNFRSIWPGLIAQLIWAIVIIAVPVLRIWGRF